jgi:hypothetical protein
MEDNKLALFTETEKDLEQKLANLKRRKEEAAKLKQASQDMLQATISEFESQQLANNLFQTEVKFNL